MLFCGELLVVELRGFWMRIMDFWFYFGWVFVEERRRVSLFVISRGDYYGMCARCFVVVVCCARCFGCFG